MARDKQLSKDYIECTLSLNTRQLQTEYGKMVDENKELQKQANETRKKMAELEKQGKKNSWEWQNLYKQAKPYRKESRLMLRRLSSL